MGRKQRGVASSAMTLVAGRCGPTARAGAAASCLGGSIPMTLRPASGRSSCREASSDADRMTSSNFHPEPRSNGTKRNARESPGMSSHQLFATTHAEARTASKPLQADGPGGTSCERHSTSCVRNADWRTRSTPHWFTSTALMRYAVTARRSPRLQARKSSTQRDSSRCAKLISSSDT